VNYLGGAGDFAQELWRNGPFTAILGQDGNHFCYSV